MTDCYKMKDNFAAILVVSVVVFYIIRTVETI